jgi:hypothetical protein
VRAACGVACALVLAACGSGGSPSPTLLARPAASYLLTLDELRTPGFTVVEAAHVVDPASLLVTPQSAGIRDAATARYFRTVPALTTANGPLDVRTTVLRCASGSGAHSAFSALTRHTDAVTGIVPESAGALGDEAHADQLLTTSPDGVPLVEVTLTWRVANLVNVLVVRGRDAGTGLSDALLLAHAEAAGQD